MLTRPAVRHVPRSATNRVRSAGTKEGRMTTRRSISQGCDQGPDKPGRLLRKATAGCGPPTRFVADDCVHQQSASGLSAETTGRVKLCTDRRIWTVSVRFESRVQDPSEGGEPLTDS